MRKEIEVPMLADAYVSDRLCDLNPCSRNQLKDPATIQAELILKRFGGALAFCQVLVSISQPSLIVIISEYPEKTPTPELRPLIAAFAKGFQIEYRGVPTTPTTTNPVSNSYTESEQCQASSTSGQVLNGGEHSSSMREVSGIPPMPVAAGGFLEGF